MFVLNSLNPAEVPCKGMQLLETLLLTKILNYMDIFVSFSSQFSSSHPAYNSA